MKVPVISSLLLMLGIASPLSAIERPKALDEKAKEEAAVNRAVEVPEDDQELPQDPRGAWLGVYGQVADEALAAHLGLKGGVVMRFVAEGSPAAKAGLRVHDVVSTVGGKPVNSQADLREAVMGHQPGAEVVMDVVSGGEKKQVTVVLGERPADVPRLPGVVPGDRLQDWRRQMREMNPGAGFEQHIEEQFRAMEEQLKMLELQPGFRGLEELLGDLPKGDVNAPMVNMKQTGSVKLLDENGSIEMKMTDGAMEVKAHDKDGNLLYEGPWDTAQDKEAVDPELRERIERLNFNNKQGALRLQFRQELPPAGDDNPEPDEAPGADVR